MKLHIGCGTVYLPGYVNIDLFSPVVADKICPAWDLDYGDESVEEIVSYQLIEHLGFVPTIYSLAEWYRVLQPEGILVIETVDLETILQKTPLDHSWLFGTDAPGMAHRYCFDEEELRKVITEAGFTSLTIERKTIQKRPVLRINARKEGGEKQMLISKFRKILLEQKVIDLEDLKREDAAYEGMLNRLYSALNEHPQIEICSLLVGLASFQPRTAEMFFSLLSGAENYSDHNEDLERAKEISRKLQERNFVAHLADLYCKTEKASGSADLVFKRVLESAGKYITGLFRNTDKEELLSLQLLIWSKDELAPVFQEVKYFSPEALRGLSENLEFQGIKGYVRGNRKRAREYLQKAVSFNPDNCFAYWNLARLALAREDVPGAIIQYERAYEVVPGTLREELVSEIRDVTRNKKQQSYLTARQHVYY